MLFQQMICGSSDPFNEITTDEFRVLRARKISDYFPDAVDPNATVDGIAESLNYDAETIARFAADFDRVFQHRRGLQGLAKAKAFKKWWDENRSAFVTRPVVASYKETGLTIGELLDDLHLHFMSKHRQTQTAHPIAQFVSRAFKSRLVITTCLTFTFLISKFGIFIWSLAVLGPGVQMVNSYTQTVITPLAQTASQKGSRDLGPLASSIQSWLTNREKLKEVSHELHETTEKLKGLDFRKLTAGQTREKWAEFEQTYFKLFLAYNQTLPSHLRDGRGCFRDWMIFTPIGLASNLSTFDTQYWMHRNSLKGADGKMKTLHLREMATAESRIAATLAAWKLYEFMYPEFSREPANLKSKNDLRNSYRTFINAMRFDIYVNQFAAQIEEVLKHMDAEFILQDQLAASAANGRVLANQKTESIIVR